MTDWEVDCMKWRGRKLDGAHGHWCMDWDGLPVDETCEEWPHCRCFPELRKTAYVRDIVLEEAARRIEKMDTAQACECAAVVRALKEEKP